MISNPEQIKTFVHTTYPYLGVNKQQEVSRLLFEIAKRERIDYTVVAGDMPKPPSRFSLLKDYLLHRRYPSLATTDNKIRPSLFDISIDPAFHVDITLKPPIKPKNLFIEESVLHTEMVKRVMALFSGKPC